MADSTPETVQIATYLFGRLRQLGVRSIFGVPGDFNLRLLDYVEPCGLQWVGNCNELNAAYAADGYGRVGGLGALITTFGVGELSAINGIAAAYAEKAPVIHIVGTPARESQNSRLLLHHTFADGDFRRFAAMHAHVTAAQCNLSDPRTAPEQIDWILQQALIHSRPVYLEVPDDLVSAMVPTSRLTTSRISVPDFPKTASEPLVVQRVLERVYAAKRPMILVDGESRPMKILSEMEELVRVLGWPTWTTPFGKGLINEQLPNIQGVYMGPYGSSKDQEYFQSADLILDIGSHHSDTNTQIFTTIPSKAASISFTEGIIRMEGGIHRDVSCKRILKQILAELDRSRIPTVEAPPKLTVSLDHLKSSDTINQEYFYRFVNPILRENDIVLTETGTASHGGRAFVLQPNTPFFSAITWLSIGYMLPATLGAGLARRDVQNLGNSSGTASATERVVLFIGDGSLQMTVQEISTMIHNKLNAIIFIINNDGYTIERAIHGRNQAYNGVAVWRNLQALNFFGADSTQAETNVFSARNWGELEAVMKSKTLIEGSGVRLVEVFMERDDCPGALEVLMKNQIAGEKDQVPLSVARFE
jgi:pyruvate decarboxylase